MADSRNDQATQVANKIIELRKYVGLCEAKLRRFADVTPDDIDDFIEHLKGSLDPGDHDGREDLDNIRNLMICRYSEDKTICPVRLGDDVNCCCLFTILDLEKGVFRGNYTRDPLQADRMNSVLDIKRLTDHELSAIANFYLQVREYKNKNKKQDARPAVAAQPDQAMVPPQAYPVNKNESAHSEPNDEKPDQSTRLSDLDLNNTYFDIKICTKSDTSGLNLLSNNMFVDYQNGRLEVVLSAFLLRMIENEGIELLPADHRGIVDGRKQEPYDAAVFSDLSKIMRDAEFGEKPDGAFLSAMSNFGGSAFLTLANASLAGGGIFYARQETAQFAQSTALHITVEIDASWQRDGFLPLCHIKRIADVFDAKIIYDANKGGSQLEMTQHPDEIERQLIRYFEEDEKDRVRREADRVRREADRVRREADRVRRAAASKQLKQEVQPEQRPRVEEHRVSDISLFNKSNKSDAEQPVAQNPKVNNPPDKPCSYEIDTEESTSGLFGSVGDKKNRGCSVM